MWKMRNGVSITDRKWYLKTYESCFVGEEAVTWLMNNAQLQTRFDSWRFLFIKRSQAIEIGQQMLHHQLFYHVLYSEPFRDGYFFYRFQQVNICNFDFSDSSYQDNKREVLNTSKVWILPPRPVIVVLRELVSIIYNTLDKFLSDSGDCLLSFSDYLGRQLKLKSLAKSEEFRQFEFAVSELQRV